MLFFRYRQKAHLYRGAYRVPLFKLSVCVSVCVRVTFVVFMIARAVRGRFPPTRGLWKRASMGSRVGCVSWNAVARWSRSPGCCGFRGGFLGAGGIISFFFFFVFFFFLNAHGLL